MFDKEKVELDLSQVMLRDRFNFSREWKKLEKNLSSEESLTDFQEKIDKSKANYLSRKINTSISYNTALPISAHVDAIKDLLSSNQVLVIGGETGSGKSTQLPKICLELGLGQAGMIAHTQPRRIAARTISQRVGEELSAYPELAATDALVACKVRFSDSVKESTQIKLMTDGMLLAEIENDPFLEQYQCIIVDEVHERSLNIDFLLAYLKRLIRKRKDLRIILTSATVDLKRFSQHFNDAPVLEIEGRSYPVEIRYQSQDDNDELEEGENLLSVLDNLLSESAFKSEASDVLVFLPTEQEIRLQSKRLRKHFDERIEILPLYGRMPLAQQRKVFSINQGKRRIVLATNVAETSVTVPNIGFVIDSGLARLSRYSPRTKVQQLPIEKISQSSARQRAGRCGRIASGVCIRLYSEEDFLQRDEYTQPEIQRTNLASVLLKLKSMKLGDIDDFPLLDRPDARLVKDAIRLLFELKALDSREQLTAIGKKMSMLAIDPRFARMLIEANERKCLELLLVIVTGLSVNEPRLRPHEFQKKADEAHERYRDEQSDFYAYLRLWTIVEELRQDLSASQFRKYCEKNFLSWSNLKEWRELHHQLVLQCRHAGLKLKQWSINASELNNFLDINNNEGADYPNVHKSLLTGCLSQVAHLDEGHVYQGLHHRQVFIFPSSYLMSRRIPWIMSSQLIETSRLYAHCCARIEAEWILEQGAHILKKQYFDAFWSKRHGCVQVYQQQSLLGLIVEAKKAVKVNAENKRFIKEDPLDVFIRGALLDRSYKRPPLQIKQNWDYLDSLIEEENKTRHADLLPDENVLLAFYKNKIPETIYDVRSFEYWLKQQPASIFHLDDDVISLQRGNDDVRKLYPDFISFESITVPCEYHFEAGSDDDGLSIRLPYDQLNQLTEARLEWLVPGMIEEKCTALIKSLPKSLRKQCLPLLDTVKACLPLMSFGEGNLFDSLAQAIHRTKGIQVSRQDFQPEKMDPYLKMHIILVDENNQLISKGSDIEKLKLEVKQRFASVFSREGGKKSEDANQHATKNKQKQVYTRWDFGNLDEYIFVERSDVRGEKYQIKLFQALKDEKDAVSIAVFDNAEEAYHCHRKGQRRLMQLSLSSFRKDFRKRLSRLDERSIQLFSAGGSRDLYADLFDGLVDEVFFNASENSSQSGVLVYKQDEFETLLNEKRSNLFPSSETFVELLDQIARLVFELRQALSLPVSDLRKRHHDFIEAHLVSLIYPGFLSEMPMMILKRYPVYLQAMLMRLERLQGNIDRDALNQKEMDVFRKRFSLIKEKELSPPEEAKFWYLKLLIEEFAIALFAQELRTVAGVSRKSIDVGLKNFDV